jgi:hypothetical protein
VFEGWNASDVSMCVVEVSITGMSQALVPEDAFGMHTQLVQVIFLGNSMNTGNK